jgi:hypothetical protein
MSNRDILTWMEENIESTKHMFALAIYDCIEDTPLESALKSSKLVYDNDKLLNDLSDDFFYFMYIFIEAQEEDCKLGGDFFVFLKDSITKYEDIIKPTEVFDILDKLRISKDEDRELRDDEYLNQLICATTIPSIAITIMKYTGVMLEADKLEVILSLLDYHIKMFMAMFACCVISRDLDKSENDTK